MILHLKPLEIILRRDTLKGVQDLDGGLPTGSRIFKNGWGIIYSVPVDIFYTSLKIRCSFAACVNGKVSVCFRHRLCIPYHIYNIF